MDLNESLETVVGSTLALLGGLSPQVHKCSASAKVLNTCAPREVVSTSAPPSGVSASQTANRDPANIYVNILDIWNTCK